MDSAAVTLSTSLSKTSLLYYSTRTSAQIQSQLALLHGGKAPKFRIRNRLACVSNSVVVSGGGGGGGDGGGEVKKGDWIVVGDEDEEVIVLDVEGMTCGGCSGKVKRILESQPLVSAASVNHQTKTAIVWPLPEAKLTPNWQTLLGQLLAKHLTTCGFHSNLRGEAATEGEAS